MTVQEPIDREAELLPCPFCGGLRGPPAASSWLMGRAEEMQTKADVYGHQVRCICGAGGPDHNSEAEAIAAWNRRASPPVPAGDGDDRWSGLEALAKAATPGPWAWDEEMTPFYNDPDGGSCGGDATGLAEVFRDGDEDTSIIDRARLCDAAFIAAANPAAVLELIAAARAVGIGAADEPTPPAGDEVSSSARNEGEAVAWTRTDVQRLMHPVLEYLRDQKVNQRVAEDASERAVDAMYRAVATHPIQGEAEMREKVLNVIINHQAQAAVFLDENRPWLNGLLADAILASLKSGGE